MDPLTLINGLFALSAAAKSALDQASSNISKCKLVKDHIDMLMKSVEQRLKDKAVQNEELRDFVDKMGSILTDTQKIAKSLAKRNKISRAIKSGGDESKLQDILDRLDLLSKHAVHLTLAKVYESDHFTEAVQIRSWTVPYDEVSLFCHIAKPAEPVTPTVASLVPFTSPVSHVSGGSHIMIGGEREEGGDSWWELRKYDETGRDLWHWQCPEELGQPTDLTEVTCEGQRYLLILAQSKNKLFFLDEGIKSLIEEEVYKPPEADYRLRHVAAPDPHRAVITLDPAGSAHPDARSKLRVLNVTKLPFTEIRSVPLDCLDTRCVARLSGSMVGVVCGRPDSVCSFDVDDTSLKWKLEPITLLGVELVPQLVVGAAGDICVYDAAATQIITASGGQWAQKPILKQADLGDIVLSSGFIPESKTLVVLHEKQDQLKITLYQLK